MCVLAFYILIDLCSYKVNYIFHMHISVVNGQMHTFHETGNIQSEQTNSIFSADHSSAALTVVPSLDMSCDTCYQLTLMLKLESDWKRPVLVNLTNATVSSSEVIGSTSHVTKVIDEQTVELTSRTKHNTGSDVNNTGSGVCDPGMGVRDQGSGVHDQGSVRDQGSGVCDPGSGDHGRGVRDQGSSVRDPGSGVCDRGSEFCDPGSSFCDTGCGISRYNRSIFTSSRLI